ncbi:CDGSH iron-sulfur domain-containing protein 3, mitochondrial isoform X1 [Cebus imitator]|uniref:CDGSH iron-sulfur domain-containing protein 3, mitochondrial isoform X1 n=1 Tax=Cebus imitator TaxID=2715852 RepID=UPI00080A4D90|nr:CDGSH iron-sulfur domain-containing protein 3, mitochondrial isoform X1 [Cebus imitator]
MRGVGAILRRAARGARDLNTRRDVSSWLARWFPRTPARSVVALKTPIKVELVAGKTYRWCVCGRSKKQKTHPSQFMGLPGCLSELSVFSASLPAPTCFPFCPGAFRPSRNRPTLFASLAPFLLERAQTCVPSSYVAWCQQPRVLGPT